MSDALRVTNRAVQWGAGVLLQTGEARPALSRTGQPARICGLRRSSSSASPKEAETQLTSSLSARQRGLQPAVERESLAAQD